MLSFLNILSFFWIKLQFKKQLLITFFTLKYDPIAEQEKILYIDTGFLIKTHYKQSGFFIND
ncbi:hypothetical protein FH5_03601 [Priestia endophytica]|nr:hypothetical protein FH5_03601 [Priestia endophytica]